MGFFDFVGDILGGVADTFGEVVSGVASGVSEVVGGVADVADGLDIKASDVIALATGGPEAALLNIGSRLIGGGESDASLFSSLAPGGAPDGKIGDAVGKLLETVIASIGTKNKLFGIKTGREIARVITKGDVTLDDVFTILNSVIRERTGLSTAETRRVTQSIIGGTGEALGFVGASISDAIDTLQRWIQEVIDRIGGFVETGYATVLNKVNAVVGDLSNTANAAWTALLERVEPVIRAVSGFLADTVARLTNFIGGIADSVRTAAVESYGAIREAIAAFVDNAAAGLKHVQEAITAASSEALAAVAGIADTVSTRFADAIERITSDVQGGIAGLVEITGDVASSVRDSLDTVNDSVRFLPEALAHYLQLEATAFLDRIMADPFSKEAQAAQSAVMGALRGLGLPPDQIATLERGFLESIPKSQLGGWIVNILATVAIAVQAPIAFLKVFEKKTAHELALAFPSEKLSPADAIVALLRGHKSFETTLRELRMQGLSEEDAAILIALKRSLPSQSEVINWMHRGILSEGEADRYLAMLGNSPEDIDRTKQAASQIPGSGTLMQIASMNGFDPAKAAAWGQDQEMPEDLAAWNERIGLSREWTARQWVAHWALPTLSQGAEMLNRGLITEAQHKELLEALDVMPWWRERVAALAYIPLGRADIRRLHQLGMITRDQVAAGYRNLGFSPEDAETLTRLAETQSDAKNADDPEELTRLSRSTIINLYEDGIIGRNAAEDMLRGLAYSPDAVMLLLDASDHETERKERKEQIEIIHAQADAGIMTFAEAEDALRALGLSTLEYTKAATALIRADTRKNKVPGAGEVKAFFTAGVIGEGEALLTLQRGGYALRWAQAFVSLWRKSANASENRS